MSVLRDIDNLSHQVEDAIANNLNKAGSAFDSIVGGAQAGLGNALDMDFKGLSQSGAESLKNQLESFISSLESKIAEFNAEGNIDEALKGSVRDAAVQFVEATKKILQAYVSRLRQEIKELEELIQNYGEMDTQIGQQVTSNADEVRGQADSIQME